MPEDQDIYSRCFYLFNKTLRHDYICFDEAKTISDRPYLTAFNKKVLNGEGYEIQFAYQMDTYIAVHRNPTMQFVVNYNLTNRYKQYSWGMDVRRFGDDLIVIKSVPECALRPGMHIVAANIYGEPNFIRIPTLAKYYEKDALYGETIERELWNPCLHYMNRYLIYDEQGSGCMPLINTNNDEESQIVPTTRIKLTRLPADQTSLPFECSTDDSNVVMLTLHNLDDEVAFWDFIAQKQILLENAKGLIIDVRSCSGGTETAILPLLPYLIAKPTSLAQYLETRCITNYSIDNCKRLTAEFSYIANQPNCSIETQAIINDRQNDLSSKFGIGLIEEDIPIIEEVNEIVQPAGNANHVCLLTDVNTTGAAEIFAEICRDSSRSTTIGRASRGARGFFNLIAVNISCFGLIYPMSRFTDEGLIRHFYRVGVPPEIYIPWTPEFLEKDLDIEKAKDIIA